MFRIKFPWFIAELDAAIGKLLSQLLICMQQIFFEEILFEIWPDYPFFCIQFSNMTGCWFPFFTISDLIQSHVFLSFMHFFFNIIKYLFSSAVLISLHHHCCSSVYLFFSSARSWEVVSQHPKICFVGYGKSNQWLLPFILFTGVAGYI